MLTEIRKRRVMCTHHKADRHISRRSYRVSAQKHCRRITSCVSATRVVHLTVNMSSPVDAAISDSSSLPQDLDDLLTWHDIEASHVVDWQARCEAEERRSAMLEAELAAIQHAYALPAVVENEHCMFTLFKMLWWFFQVVTSQLCGSHHHLHGRIGDRSSHFVIICMVVLIICCFSWLASDHCVRIHSSIADS